MKPLATASKATERVEIERVETAPAARFRAMESLPRTRRPERGRLRRGAAGRFCPRRARSASSLPCPTAQSPMADTSMANAPMADPRRVLVVED